MNGIRTHDLYDTSAARSIYEGPYIWTAEKEYMIFKYKIFHIHFLAVP